MSASGSSPDTLLEPLREERMRFDLAPMRGLLDALGQPESDLPVVLVAGTNGKGAVAALLASIAEAAGYRVGLYVSPHLEDVRERIRLGGESVESDRLAGWLERVLEAAPERPTYFEALTGAALLGFRESSIDLAILEVGLGGRLDATNVTRPILSIITSIDLDHREILGETPEAIAREKAGILRPGVPAILGEMEEGPAAVLARRAAELGTEIETVRTEGKEGLGGSREAANRSVAAVAARRLGALGWDAIEEEAIRCGTERLRWPGRQELVGLPGGRSVLLDCAHNPGAIRALVSRLDREDLRRGLLFGCLVDKDARGMLSILAPRVGSIRITTPPDTARARPAADLAAVASALAPGRLVEVLEWPEAFERALAEEPHLVVTGSFRLVGPARTMLRHRFGRPAPAAAPLWPDPSEGQPG